MCSAYFFVSYISYLFISFKKFDSLRSVSTCSSITLLIFYYFISSFATFLLYPFSLIHFLIFYHYDLTFSLFKSNFSKMACYLPRNLYISKWISFGIWPFVFVVMYLLFGYLPYMVMYKLFGAVLSDLSILFLRAATRLM